MSRRLEIAAIVVGAVLIASVLFTVCTGGEKSARATEQVQEEEFLLAGGSAFTEGVPLAIHDPQDLEIWRLSQEAREIKPGELASIPNSHVQEQFRLSRRIVLLKDATRARVTLGQGQALRAEVLEGANAGAVGFVPRACVFRPGTAPLEPVF